MPAPSDRLARTFYILGLAVLVIACLYLARAYLVPIAIAILVYLLINAFAASLQRTAVLGPRLPGWLAKLFSIIGLFALISVSVRVIANNVTELGDGLPADQGVLLARFEAMIARLGLNFGMTATDVFDRLALDQVVGWALGVARGLISDVSLVFLYVLFLLIDERFYDRKLRALFPDDGQRRALEASLHRISTEVRLYLWLMTLVSLGVALMTFLACRVTGLDGAGFWAFLAFALNFVPTIGSITAVVLPAVFGLLTLEDPTQLAILIAALAATQFVAGELVLPRLMGERLNLSSFVILLTLVVWGALWGPAGMFMAIPITVSLAMIAARFEATRPVAVFLSKDGRIPDA
ncbi:MAG: AI-2E family transporter [Pseudomonadota bacterium]